MHSTSRPTCPSSTSLIVTTAVMTPSVLGQTQTDQSVQRASGTGSEGEGRLGPLLNQQQTQRTHPTRPPTSAVRGWPHWEGTEQWGSRVGRILTGVATVIREILKMRWRAVELAPGGPLARREWGRAGGFGHDAIRARHSRAVPPRPAWAVHHLY